ncbi:APC family permease [Granulicella mallensis]|uniref:Amino acid permease-associated region n=1 Tax=Granulicella mallensis (strain ATCC BAA-1857 / DSM 23137 / MP5ACTX8) TaxID=682795 RepID=G8NNW4_GRAMM|nr:APC family permease [Granulicella mallensis]AEU37068.1 amino acid permease-associated region [Granulicella mallensis MP5ACTX8]
MSIFDVLFGKPLATSAEHDEHIGVAAGVPIFGLDGLTSAAYGPEAAMTLLIPLGVLGVSHYLLPIFGFILTLLVILYFSYRQTIIAYPNGGGSYTVASENLGDGAGLLAAAALMIDYILTAAVGVSAGVTALVSAVPELHPHQLLICLFILAAIAIVNMRGVRETGFVFMVPTFLFVGTILATIGVGVYRSVVSGGHPVAVLAPPPPIVTVLPHLSTWLLFALLLKAFSSGCAAMTGVEAVSNGTTAFKEPRSTNANRTLTVIIGILIILLAGLSYVARAYGVTAMDPDAHNFQSVLSIAVAAVFGRGWFYFLTMGAVLAALSFSANTAFADFPRMARAIAVRDYLPHVFLLRGRRLLFSHGIYALTGFTAIILIIFNGVTDRLIPLYAIGAFLAFTLSQAGMVRHWVKEKDAPHRHIKMFLNGLGAVATGITLLVVLTSKFMAGAWVTALLVPFLIGLMMMVKRHYVRVKMETEDPTPLRLTGLEPPIVVIPMARWDKITEKAMRFGMLMSPIVKVVHVDSDDSDALGCVWDKMVIKPVREHNMAEPELITVKSSYRTILSPLMDYVLKLEDENPGRKIAVLLPELVVRHWWENLLHNQRVQLLKLMLLLKGNQRIVVVNIPWYL